MPAALLGSRPARMENGGAVFSRQTRKLEFLESRRGNRGDLPPILEQLRPHPAHFTKPPIRRIMLVLQSKKLKRQPGEIFLRCSAGILPAGQAGIPARSSAPIKHGTFNKPAQSRCETRKCRCRAHAVFIFARLVFRHSPDETCSCK